MKCYYYCQVITMVRFTLLCNIFNLSSNDRSLIWRYLLRKLMLYLNQTELDNYDLVTFLE